VSVPGWLHLLELVIVAIVLLSLAVLISAFGWFALLLTAICGAAVWIVGRRVAHRMRHHRYPSL
jgi:hypothetical protein